MPFSPPDGLVVVVKRDCPTCEMVVPVLRELAVQPVPLTVYVQDDPTFPEGLTAVSDTTLEASYHLNIEIVPTLLRVAGGQETVRVEGWNKENWRALTAVADLGETLPDHRPGCGSKSVEPGMPEKLAVRFGDAQIASRRVEVPPLLDEIEFCYEQGWSDGLPVVPPTEERVYRMLQGTTRDPQAVLGLVPPNKMPLTVEKVAINAVLAGCKPEYMPVVLTAVSAALRDEFCMHGILATTYFSSPVVIVNGPVARQIGMNSGVNVLGQGNRANATIGRALQLVIRNVGGGRPGEIDRAVLGTPGKYTFCFAENEADSPWEPLAVSRGVAPGQSAVTLFAGDGVHAVVDQLSRTPESLARSFAATLKTVAHEKLALASEVLLVVSPEHGRTFRQAGWSRQRLLDDLHQLLLRPGSELVRGANGIAEGLPEQFAGETAVPKFPPNGMHIVHAGGPAGMFSAVIGGWVATGSKGTQTVTEVLALDK